MKKKYIYIILLPMVLFLWVGLINSVFKDKKHLCDSVQFFQKNDNEKAKSELKSILPLWQSLPRHLLSRD